MAYSDLASNETITFTDMQSSGIPLNAGQSAVTSNEAMTKSDMATMYIVDTAYASFAALNSNELVTVQDVQIGYTNSGFIYGGGEWDGLIEAYGSGSAACAGGVTTYYDIMRWSGDLQVGTKVSLDWPATLGYYYFNGGYIKITWGDIDGFWIEEIGSCGGGGSISRTVAYYVTSPYDYSLTLYVNGTQIAQIGSGGAGSTTVIDGDTIRITTTPIGFNNHSTQLSSTGDISIYDSGTDLVYDSGNVTVTQDTNFSAEYGLIY